MSNGFQKGISLKKLVNSFKNAFSGLRVAIFQEQTFKIQTFIAIFVLLLSFYFKISKIDFLILFLVIILVLSLELINSQIERILDYLNQEFDEKIKIIKDLSAAAVLLAALSSLVIGFLIFIPYIIK
jgi:diacylglycerol kinase